MPARETPTSRPPAPLGLAQAEQLDDPGVVEVRDHVGLRTRAPASVRCAGSPRRGRRRHPGGPTRSSSGQRRRAGTASKLPAYSSASTMNAAPRPSLAVAGIPPLSAAGSKAPTNAPGSAPISARTHVSQPAAVLLPCVPATATSVRPCGRVGDDLLPGLGRNAPRGRGQELRMVRRDRGQGLRDGEPVRAWPVGDVRGVVRPGDRDADGLERVVYGDGPPGSQPLTSAPCDAAWSAAADAPAPAMPRTWIRSPARMGRDGRAGLRPAPSSARLRVMGARPRAGSADAPRCRRARGFDRATPAPRAPPLPGSARDPRRR